MICFCIQNSGSRVKTLTDIIENTSGFEKIHDVDFISSFEDRTLGHRSDSDYKMIVIKKTG